MTAIRIRPAQPEDAQCILHMIEALAAFEGSPGAVALTEEVIRRDAFGDQARFEVLLAEIEGEIGGAVTLFRAYSSWRGAPSLVIHDLFVEERFRAAGLGGKLVAAAARRALESGCCRVDVNVLDWNARARGFYGAQGFEHQEGWLIYRLQGDALTNLAASENIG